MLQKFNKTFRIKALQHNISMLRSHLNPQKYFANTLLAKFSPFVHRALNVLIEIYLKNFRPAAPRELIDSHSVVWVIKLASRTSSGSYWEMEID